MILVIENKTKDILTYDTVTIKGEDTLTITNDSDALKVCLHEDIIEHLISEKALISDGGNQYKGSTATKILREITELLLLKKIAGIT